MGCDIHMYVEYRREGGTTWFNGDLFYIGDPTDPNCEKERVALWVDRCYSLFAVLANVRNDGTRHAGFYKYISAPKGLPEDVTPYVKSEYEWWGIDAHHCSYLTARELVDFRAKHRPINSFGGDILEPLLDRLKRRADELDVIYDFQWDKPMDVRTYNKLQDIRIVFWFDN